MSDEVDIHFTMSELRVIAAAIMAASPKPPGDVIADFAEIQHMLQANQDSKSASCLHYNGP